jgi:hypothetical protein
MNYIQKSIILSVINAILTFDEVRCPFIRGVVWLTLDLALIIRCSSDFFSALRIP